MNLTKSVKKTGFGFSFGPDGDSGLSSAVMERLFPIRNFSEEVRCGFVSAKKVENFSAGTELFRANTSVESAIYLIRGSVLLTDQNADCMSIHADHPLACFPLCSGTEHTGSAVAQTEVGILRVAPDILSVGSCIRRDPLPIGGKLSSNRMLALFSDHFQEHQVTLQSMPHIASRLKQCLQGVTEINRLLDIIQLDPAIAAKLVEVANSPLYFSAVPVKTCEQAVIRLGLEVARDLVLSLIGRQIYVDINPIAQMWLARHWKKSLYLSALCRELATLSGRINPDAAGLAGLICDIGEIPFLALAGTLPQAYVNQQEVIQALPFVGAMVGAILLKEWRFHSQFIAAAAHGRNMKHDNGHGLNLADIVVLARWHRLVKSHGHAKAPDIGAIVAARKFKRGQLSPATSLRVCQNAKNSVRYALEARGLLDLGWPKNRDKPSA